MMTKDEVADLKVGDKIVVELTGCLGEFNAEVIDKEGTKLHPGPWLKLDEDGFVLKTEDFIPKRRA